MSKIPKRFMQNKKVIIVAGQSNAIGTADLSFNLAPTGSLERGMYQVTEAFEGRSGLSSAGVSNLQFTPFEGAKTSYAYGLMKRIKDELKLDELVLLPAATGATGFADNTWQAESLNYQRLMSKIEYLVGGLGCEVVGIFWTQGENDVAENPSLRYGYFAYNLLSSVRSKLVSVGQKNGMSVPVVTGQMVEDWVGVDVGRNRVQNVLKNVGNVLNNAQVIDISNLPPHSNPADIIHFDTAQTRVLEQNYFDAWMTARTNTIVPVAAGSTLLLEFSGALPFSNNFMAFWRDTVGEISRLGELYRYDNDGKYRFRVEWDVVGGGTEYVEFEQDLNPVFATYLSNSASIVDVSANAKIGVEGNEGFCGLVYGTGATLLKLTRSTTFTAPIGQAVAYATDKIPIGTYEDGTAIEGVNLKLYAIKE